MIAAIGLTRRFGDRTAVEDVSFDVRPGEIVALVGPNGAGKTTTLRMLAGLIAPTSGSVVIDGVPLTPGGASELRARIGFLTETPGLWDRLTVRENLQVYAGLYELDTPARAIDRVLDLLHLADRAATRAVELSKGMRQKLALARALLHDPPVLLLDEPMSGLDPEITRSVRRLLEDRREDGCAILVSTHDLDEVERLADRVAVLSRRLLALDRPETLRRRLTAGRVVVRVNGAAQEWIDAARTVSPGATAEGMAIEAPLAMPERDVPALVRALVMAGAEVVEVRPDTVELEAVYLRLVGAGPERGSN
ncbi:MAG: ABC transporter ATP-binding protein [Betaproteobacteria bacterium]